MRPRLLPLLVVFAACNGPAAPPADEPTTHGPAGEASPVAVPADVEVPDEMAYVPAGTTTVGVLPGEGGMPHERPAFDVEVAAFLLDRSPVTVGRFRQFVAATGWATEAEGFGDGAVMNAATGQWGLVRGADWRHPFGPAAPPVPDDHPVTQVSWADAAAFCAWDGAPARPKRLPTEVEWEHAARGGVNDRSPYAWGDALGAGDAARANTWTGTFPAGDDGADGYAGGTSPVGAFGATPLGLTDLGGNVWEWTASAYGPYPPARSANAPGARERVQRGGSYLCHPSYCHGYRVSARSHSSPESSFAHVGFRCARDLPVEGA